MPLLRPLRPLAGPSITVTTLDLLTSLEAFDDLHAICDSNKAVVKVDRQKLHNLLLDHSEMINGCKRAGITCRDPDPPAKRRVRL